MVAVHGTSLSTSATTLIEEPLHRLPPRSASFVAGVLNCANSPWRLQPSTVCPSFFKGGVIPKLGTSHHRPTLTSEIVKTILFSPPDMGASVSSIAPNVPDAPTRVEGGSMNEQVVLTVYREPLPPYRQFSESISPSTSSSRKHQLRSTTKATVTRSWSVLNTVCSSDERGIFHVRQDATKMRDTG